jgi:hypothetical protein
MGERSWGLTAVARSGQVALDLDGSNDSGPVAYMLTVALPSIELRFELAGPDAMKVLSMFMRENHGQKRFAEMQIGVLDHLPVRLIKDDKHPDRFFIRAGQVGMIDVTIVDPDSADLARAAVELAAEVATG